MPILGKMAEMLPSPKELDAQSVIKIDEWLDVSSQRCKDIDDDYALTKRMLKVGFEEPAFLACDLDGRIFGRGENGRYYPFHFEYGHGDSKKLIGYRLSSKAAN